MAEAAPARRVLSPCIGICTLDSRSGYCVGCKRTVDEIARWMTLDAHRLNAALQQATSGVAP